MADAVDRGIPHVDVGTAHVDLEPEHVSTVGELAGLHAAQQVQVLDHAAAAVGAVDAGLGQRAARGPHLLGRLAVNVRQALLHEPFGKAVKIVVVVRRVVAMATPIEAQPAHGVGDRILELHLLLEGVGVVVAQMAGAAVFLGKAKIEDDGLRVTVMQVAVGLGGKPRDHAPPVLAGAVVLSDDGAQEVGGRRGGLARGRRRGRGHGHVLAFSDLRRRSIHLRFVHEQRRGKNDSNQTVTLPSWSLPGEIHRWPAKPHPARLSAGCPELRRRPFPQILWIVVCISCKFFR